MLASTPDSQLLILLLRPKQALPALCVTLQCILIGLPVDGVGLHNLQQQQKWKQRWQHSLQNTVFVCMSGCTCCRKSAQMQQA
jgi:hypothetical protein